MAASLCAILLFSLAFAAQSVAVQKPLVRIPVTRNFIPTGNKPAKEHRHHDRALDDDGTANSLMYPRAVPGTFSASARSSGLFYTTTIGVGNPPKDYTVLIDFGIGIILIGADARTPYHHTSTTESKNETVTVSLGSVSVTGNLFVDQITVGAGITAPSSLAVVSPASLPLAGVGGVLGLGRILKTPADLVYHLFATIRISNLTVGVSFQPPTTSTGGQLNGELTFGGTDSSRYIGDITYTNVTNDKFWGVNATINYGSQVLISNGAGIIDTNTYPILMSSNAFDAYRTATGGVLANKTNMLSITAEQAAALQSIFFNVSGTVLEITPDAQMIPRALNSLFNVASNVILLGVGQSDSTNNFNFTLGMLFMEHIYTAFDIIANGTTNTIPLVGFAPASFGTSSSSSSSPVTLQPLLLFATFAFSMLLTLL